MVEPTWGFAFCPLGQLSFGNWKFRGDALTLNVLGRELSLLGRTSRLAVEAGGGAVKESRMR